MKLRLVSAVLAGSMIMGYASAASQPQSQSQIQPQSLSQPHNSQGRSDPFEGFNRAMFNVNYNYLDPYFLRPVAVVWRDYMPVPARNGLTNFFDNLSEPASMANSFAEGQITEGFKHFTRFFLNTILGLGGLIDVASMANKELPKEEPKTFGSTLGYYGVPYGPYMVLPVYGSFTVRQDGGNYVDYLYPPLSLLTFVMNLGKWAIQGIETRANLLDADELLRNSADPYAMMRDAYFQRNDFLVNGGKSEMQNNPNSQAIQGDLQDIDAGSEASPSGATASSSTDVNSTNSRSMPDGQTPVADSSTSNSINATTAPAASANSTANSNTVSGSSNTNSVKSSYSSSTVTGSSSSENRSSSSRHFLTKPDTAKNPMTPGSSSLVRYSEE